MFAEQMDRSADPRPRVRRARPAAGQRVAHVDRSGDEQRALIAGIQGDFAAVAGERSRRRRSTRPRRVKAPPPKSFWPAMPIVSPAWASTARLSGDRDLSPSICTVVGEPATAAAVSTVKEVGGEANSICGAWSDDNLQIAVGRIGTNVQLVAASQVEHRFLPGLSGILDPANTHVRDVPGRIARPSEVQLNRTGSAGANLVDDGFDLGSPRPGAQHDRARADPRSFLHRSPGCRRAESDLRRRNRR